MFSLNAKNASFIAGFIVLVSSVLCQILAPARLLPPLVLVGMGEGLGLGVELGLGNQVEISTRGGNNLAGFENRYHN